VSVKQDVYGCPCDDFQMALRDGTDQDGHGPHMSHYQGHWDCSYILPEPKYCAWCGSKLGPPPEDKPDKVSGK